MPGWGSWEWVGAETAAELAPFFETTTFVTAEQPVPDADVVVLVKFKPPHEALSEVRRRSAVIYCPVDFYGSAEEISPDAVSLVQCDRVVVHCRRLVPVLGRFARAEYMDHHVRFMAPPLAQPRREGPVLWVGVRSNLPSLVGWVNEHSLPGELWVLTNPEHPADLGDPRQFGFRTGLDVRLGEWTPPGPTSGSAKPARRHGRGLP